MISNKTALVRDSLTFITLLSKDVAVSLIPESYKRWIRGGFKNETGAGKWNEILVIDTIIGKAKLRSIVVVGVVAREE